MNAPIVPVLLLAGALACPACRDSSQPAPVAPPPPPTPAAKRAAAPQATGLEASLAKAARWLGDFPERDLRFDAAIGLHEIVRLGGGEAFRPALEKARTRAEKDGDNPMLRIWKPDFRSPPEHTAHWTVPAAGQKRINVNRPVIEALHCAQNGLRPETLAYITGPMRDGGGYHSTHALWALILARQQGCLDEARFTSLSAPVRKEIRAAQPRRADFAKTMDLDLYAERALMLILSGDRKDAQTWVDTLRASQNRDGSWGLPAADEPPYYRFHATLASCWALAAFGAAPQG